MSKPTKMQTNVLSAASKRTDATITVPPELKGAAKRAFAVGLIGQGWARETRNGHGGPAGPAPAEAQSRPSLVITALGRQVITWHHEAESAVTVVSPAPKQVADSSTCLPELPAENGPAKATKQALVIGLLTRPEGASCDELITATGWLPHTVRAALVRLRQKGLSIVLSRGEDEISRYRLVEATAA
ncbi:DUF3489 domain-containing protein [Bosea sp. (in: a-proteobacteria)]|uniref:DUF3489 domain-containing protein n=1 Tax=Bosea sp. (in: a-proteobacteria) TaxID=1871050 RepID=UPI0026200BD9|nr:DUF3489 domain-containing protein [Bosea sp. (in: a-proteobacteria)]MCO5093599.1 DUF3489 domain-containing protein [Bosea sp. (in: a-proteobacteria)]